MDPQDPGWLDLPASAVCIESHHAIDAARKYVELAEAQLSQAQSDLHSAAVEAYGRIARPDETDYDTVVGDVQRRFEEDYRPILRFTEVIYLYMVFETYVRRHIDEIESELGAKPGVVERRQ